MPIDDDLNVQDDGQKPSVVDAYAERLVMAQMQREAHQRTVYAEIARARRRQAIREGLLILLLLAVAYVLFRIVCHDTAVAFEGWLFRMLSI